MTFLETLKKTTNNTYTDNGALTNISTLSPILDFFSLAGAMRGKEPEAERLFRKAYAESPLLALRALFYLRDIRGGQGERSLFRSCLKHVPGDVLKKNIQSIPVFGRYDDLFELDTDLIGDFISQKLLEDEQNMREGKGVSLLAKWMPSENTSSDKTRSLARKIASVLQIKPSQYRKKIVALRKYINILEHKMSANTWDRIDYEKTPSQAMKKHVKAFKRHDEDRYSKYLDQVESGEKKIKTSTLYTYEIFDLINSDERTANIMWENLPDYTNGNNALVIADVSGSMRGRPMSVSVSLALYFAERNKGAFHDYFMTFSAKPQLVRVLGKNLSQRLSNIENADWDQNTNIQAAFNAILLTAQSNKAEAEDMPKVLYIISDMEFDEAVSGKTNFETAQENFKSAGYTLPHVVFWNVNATGKQVPATMYDGNVTLISGCSQSTFRYAVEGKTPLESMTDILNSDRYSIIQI